MFPSFVIASAQLLLLPRTSSDEDQQAKLDVGDAAIDKLTASLANLEGQDVDTALQAWDTALARAVEDLAPVLSPTPTPATTAVANGLSRVRRAGDRAIVPPTGEDATAWYEHTCAALRDLRIAVATAIHQDGLAKASSAV